MRYNCYRNYTLFSFFIGLILLLTSCTGKPEPYSILEIAGEGELFNNYSKSFMMTLYQPDSITPTAITGSIGDLFVTDMYAFIFNDTSSQKSLSFKQRDEGLYLNNKIVFIAIPNNDELLPWFENLNDKDLSALQFIGLSPEIPDIYLPYLSRLAEIKADAGLLYNGNFKEMSKFLKIFKPRYIVGADLQKSDFDLLSGLTNLEILAISLADSVLIEPLPALPHLKQLFLLELDKDLELPGNFLINNKKIERVIIQKPGEFDLSLINPLKNLKELVIRESDEILNIDLINDHKKLEVLVLGDAKADYDLNMIELPRLRWITFFQSTTQDEFNSFINSHPDIEIIEMIENDTISSLKALSGLSKLYGLTITDSVTDLESVENLTNLKYLSLPYKLVDDSVNFAQLKKSLPDTRIVANEGFCLGSGWLLLIIPFVFIIRFFGRHGKQECQDNLKA
jgi:hypothetical protein